MDPPEGFSDCQGHEARLKLSENVNGVRQIIGAIAGVVGETIRITDWAASSALAASLDAR